MPYDPETLKNYLMFKKEAGNMNKPPKLLNFESNFDEWKWRFKTFIRINDFAL